MFKGKTILLGVCGGIACYKVAQLASDLHKTGADVQVMMTKNATEFITPLTFETLTANRVSIDTFDRNFRYDVTHISLAKRADVLLVAPATANVIAKLAHGIADDMLTTTALATGCKKLIAPAMNTGMLENPATQRNLQTLREDGWTVLEPTSGLLACGDSGRGRLPDPQTLFEAIRRALTPQDLAGRRLLVTAGPTREPVDPVRFLSNRSTGKMGYAIAEAAVRRGADVLLISGPVALEAPMGVRLLAVEQAAEMFEAVRANHTDADILIKCAAVADYRPEQAADEKIKKTDGGMQIPLCRTRDILSWLGEHKRAEQVLCGFSMETRDLIENSRAKLKRKRADLIAANSLRDEGAGFGVDTNRLTLLTEEGAEPLPLLQKSELADRLLDRLDALWRTRQG